MRLYKKLYWAACDYLEHGSGKGLHALVYLLSDFSQPLDSGLQKHLADHFARRATKGGRPGGRPRVNYLLIADYVHQLLADGVAPHQVKGRATRKFKISRDTVDIAVKQHAEFFNRLDRAGADPIAFVSPKKSTKKP